MIQARINSVIRSMSGSGLNVVKQAVTLRSSIKIRPIIMHTSCHRSAPPSKHSTGHTTQRTIKIKSVTLILLLLLPRQRMLLIRSIDRACRLVVVECRMGRRGQLHQDTIKSGIRVDRKGMDQAGLHTHTLSINFTRMNRHSHTGRQGRTPDLYDGHSGDAGAARA